MSSIQEIINKLRDLNQLNVLDRWYVKFGNLPTEKALVEDVLNWEPVILNDKNQVSWDRGEQVLWLGQKIVIPDDLLGFILDGLILRMGLVWWAIDAQIYVNGNLVQCGDLFDASTRILLTENSCSGMVFDVRLRLVSPGHDRGALMKSILLFESPIDDFPEPAFIADEMTIVHNYVSKFAKDRLPELGKLITTINEYLLPSINSNSLIRKLSEVRQKLTIYYSGNTQIINLLGHAHLDMAWLWEVNETWEVADRTFKSVLNLQNNFPKLTFCHSTPALYQWLEINNPELWADIYKKVQSDRWEIVGGMWIEPDLNLLSGESIARQILYGQQYVKSKFGAYSKVAWLPDTFGFTWQLPQLLKLGNIDYFVTQKLRWNDTNTFPYDLFWWQSPDGSKVLSLMSNPIGEGIDPVKMAEHNFNWRTNHNDLDYLWLFGVGDHGGGPTADMLNIAQRWSNSPLFPQLQFTTSEQYLHSIEKSDRLDQLPVWNNELYLEFHRGCYTTHADQKLANRRTEDLLYQAELWDTIAYLLDGKNSPHHQELIKSFWLTTLFNQFHDILPGTSITPVYDRANTEWETVINNTQKLILDRLNSIITKIQLPTPPTPTAKPYIIFNSLNWSRSAVITVNLPTNQNVLNIYNDRGQIIPSQTNPDNVTFIAENIPSVGYQIFWLETSEIIATHSPLYPQQWILENHFIKVTIDPDNGEIASFWDKTNHQEIFSSGGGNQLRCFQDSGQYWDGWNIDPNYLNHPLPPPKLIDINWGEYGDIQRSIVVRRQFNRSTITQTYHLSQFTNHLDIHTTIDWQEQNTLLKTFFPLNLTAEYITYEIANGAINRPIKNIDRFDQAKWEIPALRWANITDKSINYGVSILNNSKYGYGVNFTDITDHTTTLSLTLLRSPTWPDPNSDRHIHHFTYTIYPHIGTWQNSQTVKKGYELNSPLQIQPINQQNSQGSPNLPISQSFLNLGIENLILTTLKPSESGKNIIIRCYECHGYSSTLNIVNQLNLKPTEIVNILEESIIDREITESIVVRSWEIITLTCS